MKLDYTPIWVPAALVFRLAMAIVEPPAPEQVKSAVENNQQVVTFGDIRKLPFPDEAPFLVQNLESLCYRSIYPPRLIVCTPDDLALDWFLPDDTRSKDRIAKQVIVLTPR